MNKITVLYICPDASLGGSTRSLINLIVAVLHWVEPIVLFPYKGSGYEEMKKMGIECILSPFAILYALRCPSRGELLSHPWRIPFIKHLRLDWTCSLFVWNKLKGRHIDIVHSNYSPVTIGNQLSKLLHAKHVWHIREFLDLHFDFNIYLGIPRLRRMVNKADARIAISIPIYDHWCLKQENTWIIPNAICKRGDACYLRKKEPYLLFASYIMTEAKGARSAITAYALSGMQGKGVRLKMMGNCDDDYKKTLVETALKYGVADSVDYVPCQSNVKPWFARATAFIMASQYEGLGRVTAEAMFYGCPVIAHASGGTLDLVKNGVTGYLWGTIDECARLIQKVCTEKQEKIIMQAQEFAVKNLSQEIYGPRIMDVYNTVLGR